MGPDSSTKLNFESTADVQSCPNDGNDSQSHHVDVNTDSETDWYLADWMTHFGKRQAALVNELGWSKGRAHYVWHGNTPYTRDVVVALADWLGIRPFELLMPPHEALALRRLRETAAMIVADEGAQFEHAKPAKRKTGT